jgi:hypothetical protein
MKLVALVVVLLVACSKKEAPPRNEFEAFERETKKPYRGIFIGASGVFVDRKIVAKLDELEIKRDELAKAIAANAQQIVTFDIDDKPAKVAVDALRLFAGRQMAFKRYIMPEPTPTELCETKVRIGRETEEEMVVLSILVSTDRIWIGLSRINEFQEVPAIKTLPDVEKLETYLKEHKRTAFFEDRKDIELGAEAGTSRDVLSTFGVACKVGFIDIAVLPPDELSVVPKL